jgi:HPt (histidine-containing phosphotransfer) domain-containing protein
VSQSPADLPTVLDAQVLASLRELDDADAKESIVSELGKIFIQSAEKQIGRMLAAGSAGDGETIRQEAHSLKSSSANLGAIRFSELSRTIESLKDANHPEMLSLLNQLKDEFARVRTALQKEINPSSKTTP